MRLSLCSQVVNHRVWPQASCWLRLSLGTGMARTWQLDLCQNLAMLTAVQTSIILAVLTTKKVQITVFI